MGKIKVTKMETNKIKSLEKVEKNKVKVAPKSKPKYVEYVRQNVPKDKYIHIDVTKVLKDPKVLFGEEITKFAFNISKCKKKDIVPTICIHVNDFLNAIPQEAREMLIYNMIKIAQYYKIHSISRINTFTNDIVINMFRPEENDLIMDAIFNYVDNLDFEYSTKVEENIAKNRVHYPERTTVLRKGFVALHMFSTMLRYIFPLYEEVLSKRSDNELSFKVQLVLIVLD